MKRDMADKNIVKQNGGYRVSFNFKGNKLTKCFPTLEEAKKYRDLIYDEYTRAKAVDTIIKLRIEQEEIKKELKKAQELFPVNLLEVIEVPINDTNLELAKRILYSPITNEAVTYDIHDYLTTREATILRKRYEEYKTLEQVGEEFGITRERIRQIEVKALKRVKLGIKLENDKILENKRKRERQDLLNILKETGTIPFELEDEVKDIISGNSGVNAYNTPIINLDLSVRSWNAIMRHMNSYYMCLADANKLTVNDMINSGLRTRYDLMKLKSMGRKSVKEMCAKLKAIGVIF